MKLVMTSMMSGGGDAEAPVEQKRRSPAFELFRMARTGGNWLARTEGSLREQAVRGGFWLVLADGVTQGAGVLKLALVGRLLAPSDFGLLGIAMAVQRMVESFTDTGVMAALIQRRGDVRPYLNAAWTLQVARGVVVCLIVIAIAPAAAGWFDNPSGAAAIGCVGVSTLLWALTNPAVVNLRRDLQFRKDVTWRLVGVASSLAVAVPAAYFLRSAWALILALLAGRVGEVVASYCVDPFRPRLSLDLKRVRELIGYGRWVSLATIATFLENQVDSLAVGKLLGSVTLGFYQVGMQLSSPLARVGVHLQAVLFPSLSKVDARDSQKRVLLTSLSAMSTALLPAAALVSLAAQPIVTLVVGPQWSSAAPILRALVWAAVARTLSCCTAPLLMSMGKPRKLAEAQGIKLVILLGLLIPFTQRFGGVGASWAVAVACVCGAIIQVAMSSRLVRASWRDLAVALGFPTAAALAILASGFVPVSLYPFRLILLLAGATGYACRLAILVRQSIQSRI